MPDSSPKPRIALGADHAGFPIKETIREFLENVGYPLDDLGRWSEESVDYSDYRKAVGERAANHQADYGMAVCGTGIGISIAANQVPKIRAAVAPDVSTARLAREHNDAKVLAGRIVKGKRAIEMVQTFLSTAFLGGRHARHVEKIGWIELEERRKSQQSQFATFIQERQERDDNGSERKNEAAIGGRRSANRRTAGRRGLS